MHTVYCTAICRYIVNMQPLYNHIVSIGCYLYSKHRTVFTALGSYITHIEPLYNYIVSIGRYL